MSIAVLVALAAFAQTPAHSFKAVGDHFELDGKPFVVRSGEMHYPRVPRAYWRDRFAKAKAMGLNTICTYTFWSVHEPQPGKWDFTGNNDIATYLKLAKEAGLYIILRPGPYVCSEFDFGGLPAWLQKDRTMKVRSKDPKFLLATQRYFNKLQQQVKPYLMENGGNVIMTQVENEYGSYGDDHVYMAAIRDGLIKAGFKGQLITSDGPGDDMLNGGTLPGIPAAVNFGGGGPGAIAELEKFRPGSPKIVGEYWCGWFDHWGEKHHTTGSSGHVKDIEWFIKNDVSFNLYMFHGGTSFGYMAGANGGKDSYQPDITSYDYDSPLDESGRVTPKYMAFRDAISKGTGETLPPIPASPKTMEIKSISLSYSYILEQFQRYAPHKDPESFEEMGINNGVAVYHCYTKLSGKQTLTFQKLADYGMVFVNHNFVGTLDRRYNQKSIDLNLPENGSEIKVLVDGHGRINFGHALETEREGIDGPVTLGGKPLNQWRCEPLGIQGAVPTTRHHIDFKNGLPTGYSTYGGVFKVVSPLDTFLDLSAYTKGYVWVNGHNLGRFWNAGPQKTLYVPGCWLNTGTNIIQIFDEGVCIQDPTIAGLDHPILNAKPTGGIQPLRKEGQTVTVDGEPFVQGTFSNEPEWQELSLTGATGRYLALQVTSEQKGQDYASAAEIEILGADGKVIPNVKVIYADSEELDNENGSAANLIDHQPDTLWHTAWGDVPQPHLVIFDLGKSQQPAKLRYLPRREGVNGRIKGYRIFISDKPFNGQS
ncbi:beta-galactosidase [soil metagenome]